MTQRNTTTETSDLSVHAGHRQRLRERFLRGGPDDLAAHELLELLLGYAMPRVDVNPLAHRLIERFGSLSGVTEASVEELMSVSGVGEYTACLIRLLPLCAGVPSTGWSRPAYTTRWESWSNFCAPALPD